MNMMSAQMSYGCAAPQMDYLADLDDLEDCLEEDACE